jgi:hypothetical protein
MTSGARLTRPTAMLALWASVGALSALLVLLYHA